MPIDATPLDVLKDLPTPRVWSMLVTIFGDLARNPEDRIEGPVLTRLTEGMGLRPEAVRVALHRLRNDDWITSIKSGRTASHALTPNGRRESQAASRAIYARQDELPAGWVMALTESSDAAEKSDLLSGGFVQLTTRVFVANDCAPVPKDVLLVKGDEVPPWMVDQIIPRELTEEYEALLRALTATADRILAVPAQDMSALDIALNRCLIVHQWRRLVLRHPYLPPSLTGSDWPGHICRDKVTRLLSELPRPPLGEIQGA